MTGPQAVSALAPDQRLAAIRAAIQAALGPTALEVTDESHRHVGHAGARDGRGHFHVDVVSDAFTGLSPIARHRAIYAAVGDLMVTDIHALSISARTPAQARSSGQ